MGNAVIAPRLSLSISFALQRRFFFGKISFGVVFLQTGQKARRGQFFEVFPYLTGYEKVNTVDRGQPQICFQQGIYDEHAQFFRHIDDAARTDTSDKQGKFPAELHGHADRNEPQDPETVFLFLLENIPADHGEIGKEQK